MSRTWDEVRARSAQKLGTLDVYCGDCGMGVTAGDASVTRTGNEITSADLTDDLIRVEWNARELLLSDYCYYYALKRNARSRAELQSDDEFSLFCEGAAQAVATAINARSGKTTCAS